MVSVEGTRVLTDYSETLSAAGVARRDFSAWMTAMLHRDPAGDPFDISCDFLPGVTCPVEAAATTLAEKLCR